MTVTELIAQLQAFPGDLPVKVDWPSQMYGDVDQGDLNEIVLGQSDSLWDEAGRRLYSGPAVILR